MSEYSLNKNQINCETPLFLKNISFRVTLLFLFFLKVRFSDVQTRLTLILHNSCMTESLVRPSPPGSGPRCHQAEGLTLAITIGCVVTGC